MDLPHGFGRRTATATSPPPDPDPSRLAATDDSRADAPGAPAAPTPSLVVDAPTGNTWGSPIGAAPRRWTKSSRAPARARRDPAHFAAVPSRHRLVAASYAARRVVEVHAVAGRPRRRRAQ